MIGIPILRGFVQGAPAMRSSAGSVTEAVYGVKKMDSAAQQQLWERYFERLVRLARSKLYGWRQPEGSGDVALAALNSFFRAAEEGRCPLLEDRDDLWRWLVVVTLRKAGGAIKKARRRPPVVSLDANAERDSQDQALLKNFISKELPPDEAEAMAEDLGRLLTRLPERGKLREVAVLKADGCTHAEIAKQLGISTKSVERKLRSIREILEAARP